MWQRRQEPTPARLSPPWGGVEGSGGVCLGTTGDPDAHREAGQVTQGSRALLCQPSCNAQAQPLPMLHTSPYLVGRLPMMDGWDQGRQG